MITATEFIECFNKVFHKKYPDKGHFVVLEQYVNDTPMPVFKHYVISLYHIPSKERVATVSLSERVPQEMKAAFENKVLKAFVCNVMENIDQIYELGIQ